MTSALIIDHVKFARVYGFARVMMILGLWENVEHKIVAERNGHDGKLTILNSGIEAANVCLELIIIFAELL